MRDPRGAGRSAGRLIGATVSFTFLVARYYDDSCKVRVPRVLSVFKMLVLQR